MKRKRTARNVADHAIVDGINRRFSTFSVKALGAEIGLERSTIGVRLSRLVKKKLVESAGARGLYRRSLEWNVETARRVVADEAVSLRADGRDGSDLAKADALAAVSTNMRLFDHTRTRESIDILRPYLQHWRGCPGRTFAGNCTCGLGRALARAMNVEVGP